MVNTEVHMCSKQTHTDTQFGQFNHTDKAGDSYPSGENAPINLPMSPSHLLPPSGLDYPLVIFCLIHPKAF